MSCHFPCLHPSIKGRKVDIVRLHLGEANSRPPEFQCPTAGADWERPNGAKKSEESAANYKRPWKKEKATKAEQ